MKLFDQVEGKSIDGFACGDPCFDLAQVLAAATEWRKLDNNHWLAVRVHGEDGIHVDYALVEFAMSDADGSNTLVTRVFSGSGTGSALREMRHTWFGSSDDADQAGYVFYLPIDATIMALGMLKKYFDS
jgi:hypothetical protein